jgi:Na+/melibiose symporter-like transporter
MLTVFSRFALAGLVTLPSLLADVLDADELDTDLQRAGTFLGVWNLLTKGAAAIGPIVTGWILNILGYVPNAPQDPSGDRSHTLAVWPIPGFFCLLSYVCVRTFSLSRKRLYAIQAELGPRRAYAQGKGIG